MYIPRRVRYVYISSWKNVLESSSVFYRKTVYLKVIQVMYIHSTRRKVFLAICGNTVTLWYDREHIEISDWSKSLTGSCNIELEHKNWDLDRIISCSLLQAALVITDKDCVFKLIFFASLKLINFALICSKIIMASTFGGNINC